MAVLTFSFFVYSLLIIFVFYFFSSWLIDKKQSEQFKNESHIHAVSKEKYLALYLNNLSRSLKSIAFNPYLMSYIVDKKYVNSTEFLFLTIMLEHNDYMQLRFIGADGKEKIRFDREVPNGYPYKQGKLQDKSDKYYFQEASKLKEGEIYTSKIDYNVENGKIVEPFVPVFRVAIPIYLKEGLKGVLIINAFANDIIKLFASSASYDVLLFSKDGSLIYENEKFYDKNVNARYVTDILDLDKTQFAKIDYEYLSDKDKIYIRAIKMGTESIYMVIRPKKEIKLSIGADDYTMASLMIFILFILGFPLSFLLSKPTGNMFQKLMQQQEELKNLTETLEKRVKEKTLENAKKDRILLHQARLAELGDMIGNIAHQWRHPLTRLSLILQNLKALNKKDRLTIDKAEEMLEKANEQIFFMSDTIDNFKDFYRDDSKKNNFCIHEAYEQILDMVGHNLRHNNISIDYIDEENTIIYGNKNEFSQVLLNLIINARDALVMNSIENAYIRISIQRNNSMVVIKVKDNAYGVPDELKDKIFEPYFTTKETKGVGIGLYMVKTIINEKFDGNIYTYNDEYGAVFVIELGDA